MLARLEAAFEGQRRFVANASHELRTPLTIMRTEIDVALRRPDATAADLRQMATVVHATLERSERLVTSLLALAASQHGPEVREPVDFADVARRALDDHRPEAARRRLTIDADLRPAPLVADAGLIDRVAENLVDNAVIHNIDGGWLVVRTSTVDGDAILEVSVSAEHLGRLFQPFSRGHRSTSGERTVGIGLSIVRSVVESHGGDVHAEAHARGGLRIVARVRAAPRPDVK
jgi:hypothetical protein